MRVLQQKRKQIRFQNQWIWIKVCLQIIFVRSREGQAFARHNAQVKKYCPGIPVGSWVWLTRNNLIVTVFSNDSSTHHGKPSFSQRFGRAHKHLCLVLSSVCLAQVFPLMAHGNPYKMIARGCTWAYLRRKCTDREFEWSFVGSDWVCVGYLEYHFVDVNFVLGIHFFVDGGPVSLYFIPPKLVNSCSPTFHGRGVTQFSFLVKSIYVPHFRYANIQTYWRFLGWNISKPKQFFFPFWFCLSWRLPYAVVVEIYDVELTKCIGRSMGRLRIINDVRWFESNGSNYIFKLVKQALAQGLDWTMPKYNWIRTFVDCTSVFFFGGGILWKNKSEIKFNPCPDP